MIEFDPENPLPEPDVVDMRVANSREESLQFLAGLLKHAVAQEPDPVKRERIISAAERGDATITTTETPEGRIYCFLLPGLKPISLFNVHPTEIR